MEELKSFMNELDSYEVLDIDVVAYEEACIVANENFQLAEEKLEEYLASLNADKPIYIEGYEGFFGDILEGIKKGIKKVIDFIIRIGKFIVNMVKKFFSFIKKLFTSPEERKKEVKKKAEELSKKVEEEVVKELEKTENKVFKDIVDGEKKKKVHMADRLLSIIEYHVTTFAVHNPILPLVFETFMDITDDNPIFRINKLVGELSVAYIQYNNYIRMVTTMPVRDEKLTLLEEYIKGLEELISKGSGAKVEFPVLCRAVDCLEELVEGYIRLADYDSNIEMRDLLKKVEKYIKEHDGLIKNNDYILFRLVDGTTLEYIVVPNKDDMLATIKEFRKMFEDNSISKDRFAGSEGMANMTKLIRIAKLFIPKAAPEKRTLTLPKGDALIKELYNMSMEEWINMSKYKEVRNIIFDQVDLLDTLSGLVSDINKFKNVLINDADFIKMIAARAIKLGEMLNKIEKKYKNHDYVKEMNDVALAVSVAEKTLMDLFKVMNKQAMSILEFDEYLAIKITVDIIALSTV